MNKNKYQMRSTQASSPINFKQIKKTYLGQLWGEIAKTLL